MSNCQDKPTFLPEAYWKALANLPAFRYMKAPVNTIAELYEKYPSGNEKGTFAYVYSDNSFYAYHPRGWNAGEWKPLPTDNVSSFLEIDVNYLRESDILIYNSTKQKFVVRSGNVWNKLIGHLRNSVSHVTKFLNVVDDIPQEEDASGVYFIDNHEFKGLYLVLNKIIIKVFNSSDWYTKEETAKKLKESREYFDTEVGKLANLISNLSALGVLKTYLTYTAMQQDVENPIGDNGKPILNGQLVAVNDTGGEAGNDAKNGLYAYVIKNGVKSWEKRSNILIPELFNNFRTVTNFEFAYAIVDADNYILWGKKWDGSTYDCDGKIEKRLNSIEGYIDLFNPILQATQMVSNPEFFIAWIDKEDHVLFGIKRDTSLYSPYFDFDALFAAPEYKDDKEGRLAMTLDADGKILEATEKDGTKYIPRLKTDKLEFSGKKGLKYIGDALKSFGYFGKSDHSDKKLIQLPVPTHLAFMNLEVPKLPTTRDNNYKCPLEYWDMYGNYFKKDVIINAQGDSTLAYILKNIGLETVDGSKIQFDNWIAADSYHLKAHYTDAFRGISTLCYRYMKDITNTRPIGLRHPFDYQKRSNGFANGTGDITTDMASGANYIADGFPVALYQNGEFVSIMNMTQKKHRDNFEMDRNDPDHIWLDGTINTSTLWGEKINWPALEIRNPKPKKWDLVDMKGNKYITYDSLELSSDGNSGKVKKNLQAFSKAFADIRTNKDKAIFDNTFFADNLHDYMIFSNVLYNFDGFSKNWQWYTKDGKRWAIAVHDCDLMFGKFWRANVIMADEVKATILGNEETHPTYWAKYFYAEEFKQRYKELRDKGIVSSEYFVNKLNAWLGSITAPMLKMDLKKWNFPSYRASGTDEKNWQCVHMDRLWEAKEWDATKEYKVGNRIYVQTSEAKYVFRAVKDNQNKPPILKQVSEYTPLYLGFYESVDRVRQFLDMRIALLDSKWEYKK